VKQNIYNGVRVQTRMNNFVRLILDTLRVEDRTKVLDTYHW